MMNKLLRAATICSASLALLTTSASSAQWNWINPLPVGEELGNIVARSASDAWIVTSSGHLLHTTDAGAHWQIVYLDPDVTLGVIQQPSSALSFVGATTGWAITTLGDLETNPSGARIFKTTDGGTSWSAQTTIAGTTYGVGLAFVDANRGW